MRKRLRSNASECIEAELADDSSSA